VKKKIIERRDLYNKALNLVGNVADCIVNDLVSAEEMNLTEEEYLLMIKYIDDVCDRIRKVAEKDEDI
jgi:hypothetical protein